MANNKLGKIGQGALWVAPLVIVPFAFFSVKPWLELQDDGLSLGITAAAAIFMLGYSLFLAARVNGRMDEMEVAGQRFSQTKGMTIGSFAAVLLMLFPPSINVLVDLAMTIGTESPETAVRHGITIGFMLVVFLQMIGMIAVAVWWGRRMAKPLT